MKKPVVVTAASIVLLGLSYTSKYLGLELFIVGLFLLMIGLLYASYPSEKPLQEAAKLLGFQYVKPKRGFPCAEGTVNGVHWNVYQGMPFKFSSETRIETPFAGPSLMLRGNKLPLLYRFGWFFLPLQRAQGIRYFIADGYTFQEAFWNAMAEYQDMHVYSMGEKLIFCKGKNLDAQGTVIAVQEAQKILNLIRKHLRKVAIADRRS